MNGDKLRPSFTGSISTDKRIHELVSAAHQTLCDVVGKTRVEVSEDWSMENDPQGRPLISLDLSDYIGRVKTQFAPDELGDPSELRRRLYRIWGDLLEIRSHKLLENLIGPEGDANGP